MKSKIKTLMEELLKHPVKSGLALGLAGLVAITALKDNVHFGNNITLYNLQENHYIWDSFQIQEL